MSKEMTEDELYSISTSTCFVCMLHLCNEKNLFVNQKDINTFYVEKDVDGFHPLNVGKLTQGQDQFAPCTPLGIMHLLEEYGIKPEGKNCVVIGRSNIVGRPMAQLLMHANGTVTVCHSQLMKN